MGNLFSKMSSVATYTAADFICIIELHAAAKESTCRNLNEARERTFQSLKVQYGFECYKDYIDLIEANIEAKVSKEFRTSLVDSQIQWFKDRGFDHILN